MRRRGPINDTTSLLNKPSDKSGSNADVESNIDSQDFNKQNRSTNNTKPFDNDPKAKNNTMVCIIFSFQSYLIHIYCLSTCYTIIKLKTVNNFWEK